MNPGVLVLMMNIAVERRGKNNGDIVGGTE
jgi:hypothetical protein